ncbi:signal peptidase II [bacterium DOLZORAL124_38_8]|nr:MAG: signal peptidase II [bacterium DOLZORAL124_38_8]
MRLMWRYGIIVVGFLLDQVTKYWARMNLSEVREVFPDFLALRLAFNQGIAFSLPITRWVSSALSVVIIGYVVYLLQNKKESQQLGYYFLLAGALGNLFDRVWWGEVTDFLSVWQFPIFNVADVLVSVGVLLLVWREFNLRKK